MSFLLMLGLGLALSAMMLDFDPSEDDTGETDETEEDTGATLTTLEDGSIEVALGEDETGSLVLVNYTDTEDAGIGLSETVEQRLYLLPEGVTIPTGDDPEAWDGLELDALAAELGMELLGSWPISETEPTLTEPYETVTTHPAPVFVTEETITTYDIEANTDGDDIISIHPEGYVPAPPTFNGAERETMAESAIGSDGTEWWQAGADGLVLDGGAGSDRLEAYGFQSTLHGGDGDDQLFADTDGSEIFGDAGNDVLDVNGAVTAWGEEGDDTLYSNAAGAAVLHGGGGSDNIAVYGEGNTGRGGAGNDFLAAGTGATILGGTGDDTLSLSSGSIGDGGDGNDEFQVWNQFASEDGPAVITLGEGEDTIDARVWNPIGTASGLYLEVTDFDPAEDVLQVGTFQTQDTTVSGVTITEATDGSYSDVAVTYTTFDGETATAIMRLHGVTGMEASAVQIV